MPVMLLLCSINIQSFIHNKSSFTLQLIKTKSRDIQNLSSRIVSRKMTSTFKVGPDGRGGRSASPSIPGHPHISSVFPVLCSCA